MVLFKQTKKITENTVSNHGIYSIMHTSSTSLLRNLGFTHTVQVVV